MILEEWACGGDAGGVWSAQESSVRGFLFPGEGKVLKTVTKHVVNSELS